MIKDPGAHDPGGLGFGVPAAAPRCEARHYILFGSTSGYLVFASFGLLTR